MIHYGIIEKVDSNKNALSDYPSLLLLLMEKGGIESCVVYVHEEYRMMPQKFENTDLLSYIIIINNMHMKTLMLTKFKEQYLHNAHRSHKFSQSL